VGKLVPDRYCADWTDSPIALGPRDPAEGAP
jgi:hypothetical protein